MAIKDYEIIKQIGSGGMGAIYLARDPRLDRLVAIKKTKIPNNLEKDTHNEVVQRFYREARAVANLNHPNIVTVYDLGEDSDTNECFMVMEYLEGKSVDLLIDEQGKLSLNLSMKIGIQTCEALNYLHKKNIVHRDVKPANLMYCNSGMVKLMDFGLVRVDDNLDLTRAGTLLGSVLYMSPEQIKNPKNIDHQVDVYAFGVTMYQMLSGKFPYEGDSVWEVIRKITLESPISLSESNSEIKYSIEKVIMKSISKEKETRYQDISEMQRDLSDYNDINTKTVISPLSYARGTGQLPNLINAVEIDKTQISQNIEVNKISNYNNEAFVKTQIFEDTSDTTQSSPVQNLYKGAYKPDNYFKQFIPNNKEEFDNYPKITETKEDKIIKTQDSKKLKDTLSNYFLKKDEIKSDNYPSFESFLNSKEKSIESVRLINERLEYGIISLEYTTDQLRDLSEDLQSDIMSFQTELKAMINQYNMNLKHNFSNLDLKDLKRKIEYKKSQRSQKENDNYLIKDKLNLYSNLLDFKKSRFSINNFIIEYFLNEDKIGFFDASNLFTITETQAENTKEAIYKYLNDLKNINSFSRKLINNVDYLKKIISSLKIMKSNPIGKITRFSAKNSTLYLTITEECENNLLIEIDTSDIETLFLYCQMTRNDRPVPKFQVGDMVTMYSDLFDDSLKERIKSNTNIYKAKSRLYRKELIEEELKEYSKIIDLINQLEPIVQNNLETNFEQIIELFSEIDQSENITQEKRQSLTIKINKIKKAILDLKKDFENEEIIIKQYNRYINPILLSINKYPSLIKIYDDEIKSKKEQRKRITQNIVLQINKNSVEYIREQKDVILKSILSIKDNSIPKSITEFLKFYLLSKAKLPTLISKNSLIEIINEEKFLLSTTEIDWITKILDLNYTRDKGFFIKLK